MIRIAIYGYGNLGKATEKALAHTPDCVLTGIYTHRPVQQIQPQNASVPVVPAQQIIGRKKEFDVILNCGGSATDLPRTTPMLAAHSCVVDSFDTHAAIPEHFASVDTAAKTGGTLCVVSAGWDPGIFSIARSLASAFLPGAEISTFWGPGVSQGHSDALRRLPGVLDARQYTLPQPAATAAARAGQPVPPALACHKRVCYLVTEPCADLAALEKEIRFMPNYFAGYETEIHFITAEELREKHSELAHAGSVIFTGHTGSGEIHTQSGELSLQLGSNPEFTAGILIACARAAFRLYKAGQRGCRTLLDLSPTLLLPQDPASTRARWL